MTVKQVNKNRIQFVLVILIPTLTMMLAWIMILTGIWIPKERTNKGELIEPYVPISSLHLQDGSEFMHSTDTNGRWRLLVFGTALCDDVECIENLYKTRQVQIALGKYSDRVSRVYIAPNVPTPSSTLKKQHPGIDWLNADDDNIRKVLNLKNWPTNRVFLVDPIGNLIMAYQANQPGEDILEDLKKLIRASTNN